MKVANVLTQTQITAACRAGLAAGAKQVTVEAILPNGTKVKVTAYADGPPMSANGSVQQNNEQKEVEDWLAKHAN